ncbi:hypothetical protein PR202_gb17636 [Eleusine coracana subsp. coracana]|uniref:Uncharacterized protein n=1 Tax=Eleusine coracana subsp. coracana TaxID=191504 RepID=A0AAV5F4T4_ELECO|nr:hypothetical protein PR202_gb17636 [Eleusine coracana subsp. coracana]
MDGFGDNGLHPLFSQPDPYSPVHSFNAFHDAQSSRPPASGTAPCHALDLNSESDEWPHLMEYQAYLQRPGGGGSRTGGSWVGGSGDGGSGAGGSGGSGLPPHPTRDGRGRGKRSLGLRSAHVADHIPMREPGRQDGPLAGGGRGLRGAVRHRDDLNMNIDDIEEVTPMTQGHSEWKKLKHGLPDYLPMLEELFEGVVVDGSTSYVAGQSSDDADEDEEAADLFQDAQDTPVSTGSLKRASSTSTTGTSPIKKSKSPVIKMMRDFLSVGSKQAEEQTSMIREMICSTKENNTNRPDKATVETQQAIQLALQDGIDEDSVEFYALSCICEKTEHKGFFLNIKTATRRLAFLKRYCKEKNLM